MNRFLLYIIGIITMLATVNSCYEVIPDASTGEGMAIELAVSAPGADVSVSAVTKASEPGSQAYNENLIQTIDYFLWPDNATDTNPIISGRYSDAGETQDRKTIRIGVSEAEADLLYPGNARSCTILVIVNLPSDINLATIPVKSLSNLQQISFTTDFGHNSNSFVPQESFVMTHLGNVQLISKRKQTIAQANIPVSRVAACISASVSISSLEYRDDGSGKTWIARPGTMNIRAFNCAKKANIASDPSMLDRETDYFNYAKLRSFSGPSNGLYDSGRFYTYPMSWTHGSKDEPYLLISMSWEDGDTGFSTLFFYKVILDGQSLESNHWHHIRFNIGMIGSIDESRPTILTPELSYYVDDWKDSVIGKVNPEPGTGGEGGEGGEGGNGHDVNAEFAEARYLVLSRKTFVINNLNNLSIPFGSSHDCRLAAVYDNTIYDTVFESGDTTKTIMAKSRDFNLTDYGDTTPRFKSHDASGWLNLNMNTHMIEFHHELKNDVGQKPYDIAPYQLTFRIQHRGDENYQKYYEDITIIQYPAMYITAELSGEGSGRENSTGYMMVNNGSLGSAYYNQTAPLGSSDGISGAGNQNRNMYIITTTVLPVNSSYLLADPREFEINNLGDWDNPQMANVPGIENQGNRQLTYYYPARTSADGEHYLAPKFRIASSYGATQPISFANAQKRCASYQEEGCPAGRWRLPTVAEIKYMCQLTTDGYIPRLLGQDGNSSTDYWAGNGYVRVYGNNRQPEVHVGSTSGNDSYVRCVYDEWYWKESRYPVASDKNQFVWGDQPRFNITNSD